MARKTSRKPRKKEELKLSKSDYQFPGEARAYWTAMGATFGAFLMLVVFFFATMYSGINAWAGGEGIKGWEGIEWPWVIGPLVYPIVSIIAGNLFATRHTKQLIKQGGRHAKVMPNNIGELHKVLVRLSSLAGVKLPHMYLLDDDAPYIYSIPGGPGTIVATKALRDQFTDEEFAVLLGREIGHIKSGHMGLILANTYIANANIALKVLLFPLLLIRLLSQGWEDVADFTADRVACLLSGSAALLNETMVKKAALVDKHSEVSTDDLRAFMEGGDMSTDSAQMERQFRLGQFIASVPNMQDRIEQLSEWLRTDHYVQVHEKMERIRAQFSGQPVAG